MVELICHDCHKIRWTYPSQIGTRYALRDGIYRCQPCFQKARTEGRVPPGRARIERTLTCSDCGKIKDVAKCDALSASSDYRCRVCYTKAQKTGLLSQYKSRKVTMTCQDCGLARDIKPSQMARLSGLCKSCARRGKHSGQWKGGRVTLNCAVCGIVRQYNRATVAKMGNPYKCNSCCKPTGAANHAWNGGTSFGAYPTKWTTRLRNIIRTRDAFCCMLCGTAQKAMKLDVHHIDYDKSNLTANNLISLCRSCHPKTNFSRPYWIDLFTKMLLKAAA